LEEGKRLYYIEGWTKSFFRLRSGLKLVLSSIGAYKGVYLGGAFVFKQLSKDTIEITRDINLLSSIFTFLCISRVYSSKHLENLAR
jgi:hypothetical protein